MKRKASTLFVFCCFVLNFFTCCSQQGSSQTGNNPKVLNKEGKTISERFLVPENYERMVQEKNSFGYYLQNLPLKKDGSPVLLFDGSEKGNQSAHAAVIDMEIGKTDLQQCADAIMRLRAEYLFSQQKFESIHFNFTNGQNCSYNKWRDGYRAVDKGNRVEFIKKTKPDTSYKSFRQYLNLVFNYAGTLSLSKELKQLNSISKIKPGDVFIKGGSPGHAIIVVDVAVNKKTGKKIFILAQSYMPAQEIHVLRNVQDASLSPWYSEDFGDELNTPEWTFTKNQFKGFE